VINLPFECHRYPTSPRNNAETALAVAMRDEIGGTVKPFVSSARIEPVESEQLIFTLIERVRGRPPRQGWFGGLKFDSVKINRFLLYKKQT
jgi:hypothetical protein